MQSTFSGIELSKRALQAHSTALQTVGHNMSNASTPGFSRQRVEMAPTDALYRPQLNRAMTPGQIGQGVQVERIERVKDMLLEGRIVSTAGEEGYWTSRDKYLGQIEQVYNEPTESSLRSSMDRFWDGWQELSLFPEQMASRQAVIERGNALTQGIRDRFQSLSSIQTVVDDEIRITVDQVNSLTQEIGLLNREINQSQAAGDNPNDLMDRRDLLVEELGQILPISVSTQDPDEFSIFTGGRHIVQGAISRRFSMEDSGAERGFQVPVWEDTGEIFIPESGSLGAYLELRDQDIRQEIQNLDTMAVNFSDLVNEVHRQGYGLTGENGKDFFVQLPFVVNAQGNYDRDGDGTFDSSYLFRVTGTNPLDLQQQIGFEGVMSLPSVDGTIDVPYRSTDTVQDLLVRVNNSGAEAVMQLDYSGRLTLKGTPSDNADNPDFVLRDFSDSGEFLAGYAGILNGPGVANGYQWAQPNAADGLAPGTQVAVAPETNPSGWIGLNPELIENPGAIGTSLGGRDSAGEVGDGRIALEIASIRNTPVMIGQISTFDDYFADTVASIALKGQESEIALKTTDLIMTDLRNLRDSISGVNIDEELANMIKYQQGYNAAARFLNVWSEMLDTVINRLGV
ncbi:MAG: flagellar hook-associated protein FlgK [Spirochaetales bacterium]|nr:flagellar hook-associated protein FlgK [Spirochaetales bacterium]